MNAALTTDIHGVDRLVFRGNPQDVAMFAHRAFQSMQKGPTNRYELRVRLSEDIFDIVINRANYWLSWDSKLTPIKTPDGERALKGTEVASLLVDLGDKLKNAPYKNEVLSHYPPLPLRKKWD
jgi:hypothetical protein